MRRFKVSIGKNETGVLAEDKAQAIEKAVKKLFGKGASFRQEHDPVFYPQPRPIYGQVCQPTKTPGCYNCITGRVRVEVAP